MTTLLIIINVLKGISLVLTIVDRYRKNRLYLRRILRMIKKVNYRYKVRGPKR